MHRDVAEGLGTDVVAEDRRIAAAQPDHPRGQRRQWEAMQRWDAFDRLPQIAVPTPWGDLHTGIFNVADLQIVAGAIAVALLAGRRFRSKSDGDPDDSPSALA